MNTDYIVKDIGLREKQYRRNIKSKGNSRFYDDSCKTIKQYANEQNTIYDPMTNQILYGINSNMHVSGVSDGTCNQINPLLFTPRYMCGAGTAGGNRCVKDQISSDPYSTNSDSKISNSFNIGIGTGNKIENFESDKYINGHNISKQVIFLLIIFVLIGLIYYTKNSNF